MIVLNGSQSGTRKSLSLKMEGMTLSSLLVLLLPTVAQTSPAWTLGQHSGLMQRDWEG